MALQIEIEVMNRNNFIKRKKREDLKFQIEYFGMVCKNNLMFKTIQKKIINCICLSS